MSTTTFNLLNGSKNKNPFDLEAAARLSTVSLHEADSIKGITRLDGQMPDSPPGKHRGSKNGFKAGS